MKCNIDARGKAFRLISGLIHAFAGLVLVVLVAAGIAGPPWLWIPGVALLIAGGFQVFEGWSGWCVLRAMGLRTPV
ncbi:MAG: hypothetical protein CMJ18_25955 [Phycisphaeraceae bacterium]|nr:hypothetical protein [Phycisphaeraceae bacterium]